MVDIGMVVLLPMLMAYSLIGELFHEIVGTLMMILMVTASVCVSPAASFTFCTGAGEPLELPHPVSINAIASSNANPFFMTGLL